MRVIERAGFPKDIMRGKVALITGAGGGIGFEAARALAYLGAAVVIAEIDREKGERAQGAIEAENPSGRAVFYPVDIADDRQVLALRDFIREEYGALDVLLHNATVTPMGGVDSVALSDWDRSYAVNLRAPVLLTQTFLPWMKERKSGTIVFVPSSGAAPYMGAYEVFKTAQVELCNTLAGELEGTNVVTYAIGPGLVKTETAQKAIGQVAALMGMTLPEFYEMNESHILDAETAGAGFAVSVVNAKRYNGQEIGSIQALMDAGVFAEQTAPSGGDAASKDAAALAARVQNIVNTFDEQYRGWLERNIFERQWVLRDFKKTVGMAADAFHALMQNLSEAARRGDWDGIAEQKAWLGKLGEYYAHQHKLLQGFEKNPEKLRENSEAIRGWMEEVQAAIDSIS